MAVTLNSRSIIMTEANDAVTGRYYVESISLIGTGMVAGQRLTMKETDDAIVCDHYVEGANENVELIPNPQWFAGLKLTALPAGGTKTIVIRYK